MLRIDVKRGKEGWEFIRYVFAIVFASFTFIISILELGGLTQKLLLFVFGGIFLVYVFFFSAWFQNKLIGIKRRIEDTWRRIV